MTAVPVVGYLESAYLSELSYMSGTFAELTGMQVDMAVVQTQETGMQANQEIVSPDDDYVQGMQVDMSIHDEHEIGMQVVQTRVSELGMQANLVIYNTTQLRLLCEFPSRGVANQYGSDPVSVDNANWKSIQSMESGDLGKLSNLNTDVLEQRVQTADGVTVWELRCDTGVSNTFTDTIGILDHNITTSASVIFQGSDSQTFGTIKFEHNINPTSPYAIFIAPTLPTISARYHRFLITDPTNPDNHIRIGTIVFGSSTIFTPSETFDNPVAYGRKHFKDQVKTEGFTNKSNDRAIRRILGLSFTNLDVEGGNYRRLQEYFDFAKTDLKCLVIPTPTKPTVLTVWSKLVQLPEEQHAAIDVRDDELNAHWANLELDWDEGE